MLNLIGKKQGAPIYFLETENGLFKVDLTVCLVYRIPQGFEIQSVLRAGYWEPPDFDNPNLAEDTIKIMELLMSGKEE
jgi:hypothetical protein